MAIIRFIDKVIKILGVTFILLIAFYSYRWYELVYLTTQDFVKDGTKKPLEALYYEDIFYKIIVFFIVTLAIFLGYYLVKKIGKNK